MGVLAPTNGPVTLLTHTGPPVTGDGIFTKGSQAMDTLDVLYVCTASGTPGTWVTVTAGGGGSVSSVFTRTGAVVAASGDYSVGQVTGAAPLASPALTGSPTAPTQTAGDNSTNLATTAFVTAAIAAAVAALPGVTASWPVNSIFIGYTATNPYTLLGVGASTSSWQQISKGQMLVGQSTGDANFGTLGNTGGAVTTSLSTANLASHTHGWGNSSNTESGTHYHTGTTGDDSSQPHTHSDTMFDNGGYAFAADGGDHHIQDGQTGNNNSSHTHSFSTGTESGTHYHTGTTDNGTGSSTAFSILSPFLTVYIWRRVS